MKIRPVPAELFHADKWKERHDEDNSRFSKSGERAQKKKRTAEVTAILTRNHTSRVGRSPSSFLRLYIWTEFHTLFRPISWLKGLKADGMCMLFVLTIFYCIYMVVKSINSKPIPEHVNV